MEPIYEYFEINTKDIWPFEADMYLKSQRTDEQIYNLRNILEHLIVSKRSVQVDNNQLITIQPFVTIEDYKNGIAQQYWARHINEIRETKSQADRVRLGYFNILDRKGIDSFFSYEQDIEIDRTNDQFDFWFALKLSQYCTGIKFIDQFLNYHFIESFKSDIVEYSDFLEEVILQYKNELFDERIFVKTERWVSSLKEDISGKYVLQNSKEAAKSKSKERNFSGEYRTFVLKKAEFNSGYFNSIKNQSAIHELWSDLVQAGMLKHQTIEKFKSVFLKVNIKRENRINWSGSIKSLVEFVTALTTSNKIVEFGDVDHWLVAIECFTVKNSKDLKFTSLYKPESKDSPFRKDIELMVQKFLAKLE
jgi:hypothetical protein